MSIWMVVGTWLVAIGTLGLTAATWMLAREAMRQRALRETEQAWREAQARAELEPEVEAWLESNQERGASGLREQFAWIVVGNVGKAAAHDVEWWLTGTEKEEWKPENRWDQFSGDMSLPTTRDNAGTQRVLPAGERIGMVLWGKDSVREAFGIQIRYRRRRNPQWTQKAIALRPEGLYRRKSGEPSGAIRRIDDSLAKMAAKAAEISRQMAEVTRKG